jgi:hypothetical protein
MRREGKAHNHRSNHTLRYTNPLRLQTIREGRSGVHKSRLWQCAVDGQGEHPAYKDKSGNHRKLSDFLAQDE